MRWETVAEAKPAFPALFARHPVVYSRKRHDEAERELVTEVAFR